MCLSLVCCGGWDVGLRTRFRVAKWFYCVGFVATAVAVWVIRDYAGGFLVDNISAFELCKQAAPPPPPDGAALPPPSSADADASAVAAVCGGKEVALRVSIANLLYFGLHMLLCACMTSAEDPRVDAHAGLWAWQVLLWLGGLVGFMWFPSHALYGYAQFARYASGVFLVLQLVLLVSWVYEINEWLVGKDTRWAWALLVGGAAVTFGGGLALTIVSLYFYAPFASCSLNIFFGAWNLVLGLALAGVLFVPNRAPTAGLLTSGSVWLYCSYLLYSALASEPPNRCVRDGGLSAGGWVSVAAFFITLAALAYSTFTAGVSSKDMFGGGGGDGADGGGGELPYRADFFHLVYASASCYLAMLFTSWAVSPSTQAYQDDRSWGSTWVKIACAWACAALYGWTVIAPAVLRNRDFGPPV